MSKTIVITSGYFNPIHPGHIECFFLAKKLGDELYVIVNNDQQAELKRGTPSFQDENYRMQIAKSIKYVDHVLLSIDKDGSICETLEKLARELSVDFDVDRIIFAKGGDRFAGEVPEGKICAKYGIQIIDGLGLKTHNSSDYVKKPKIKE
jgi:cytidyltransferase-like protein